ncbi:uncharacterized protein LOC126559211 [Anopheles maculipalpis]|uniref:uncharacterized protein LOC126559211 n=1 Tax=Anopheles maculipalpis TaxID=1496333 RepID=UPI002158C91E|nr:uncharacterized protein LOC126559211 [Anopheles maculipalpis]
MKPRSSCHRLAQAFVIVWLLQASTLLLSFVQGQHYGPSDSSKEASGLKQDEDHYNTSSEMYMEESDELAPRIIQYPCRACQYRNVYAMASLKSIKAHVLMKLGIDFMPNRTYPKVPAHILSSFDQQQQQHGYQHHATANVARDPDYMEDDPGVGADEEVEEDYDYYPITNKIYILAKRE